MLTIKSRNVASEEAAKYTLILGSISVVTSFFCKYNAATLALYLTSNALLLIWIFGKKRTTHLKIQGKRLDITYGGGQHRNWRSHLLRDLSGQFVKLKPLLGTPYYVLYIFTQDKIIATADTRDGFEKSRLETLLSLIQKRADIR